MTDTKERGTAAGWLQDVEAVIFDLDGSLVDSMWMWPKIDVEYLGRFGIGVPADLQKQIEGFSFSETAQYFKQRFGLPDSVEQIKRDWNAMAQDKYMHEVKLKPGADVFLRLCQRRGIRLGIATSNSRELVDCAVAAHGLTDCFTCILTGCEVGKGKPAPDIYLEVAKRIGICPDACLVFEDILPGIMSGKAAGMRVCAVEDSYSLAQEKEKRALADFYIRDYYELCGSPDGD